MIRHKPYYKKQARKTFQLLWDNGCRNLGYGFKNSPEVREGYSATPGSALLLTVQSGQADVMRVMLATPFRQDLEFRAGPGQHTPLQESIKRRYKDIYFMLKEHGTD